MLELGSMARICRGRFGWGRTSAVFEVVGGGPVGVGGDARLVAWGGFGSEYASAVVPEGERPRSMRSDAVVWR
jgi:hypothetical protein